MFYSTGFSPVSHEILLTLFLFLFEFIFTYFIGFFNIVNFLWRSNGGNFPRSQSSCESENRKGMVGLTVSSTVCVGVCIIRFLCGLGLDQWWSYWNEALFYKCSHFSFSAGRYKWQTLMAIIVCFFFLFFLGVGVLYA